MNDNARTPLVVAGGGIGGIAVALALARRGRQSIVLEQAPEIGEIGAGIQLAPNACRMLDNLGVFDEVRRPAIAPQGATMRDAISGEVLMRLEFDAQFRAKYGYPYLVTHRSDLHSSLVEAAAATGLVEVRTNSQVVRLYQDATGSVEVQLQTGERLLAELIVGADGLHSLVRDYVAGPDALVHIGDFAYRGTVPYDEVAKRDGKDDVTWWVGPSMHLMQYPVRGGRLFNQVAVFSAEVNSLDPTIPADPAEFDRLFGGVNAMVTQGISLIDRGRSWGIVDREPLDRWTRGRVTLLGDAAHPMVQYLAQGGCQALEDAVCLAECLHANADTEAALKDYETLRAPVTATVQRWARNMGAIVHAAGVMRELRNELLRCRPGNSLPQIDWLYSPARTPWSS